jgi:hypothetical protein
MTAVSIFRVVFALSVVVGATALVGTAFDRVRRRDLYALLVGVAAAATAAWVVFALDPSGKLAVPAGGITAALVAVVGAVALQRGIARARRVEDTVRRAAEAVDGVIAREAEQRAAELERVLARARADSLSVIAEEERRIAEERRALIAEREAQAANELGAALGATQQRIEQRLAAWAEDLDRAQAQLTDQLQRLSVRQKRVIEEAEGRLSADAERLESESEAQRAGLVKLREDLERATEESIAAANAELDAHGVERRRALHELSERLRRRERELRDLIQHEEAEAMQRLQTMFTDVERRLVERVERLIERTTSQHAEQAALQFSDAIKHSREDAARRLSRELDRAVQQFLHQAETVIADRLANVGEVAAQRLNRRLSEADASLAARRDNVAAALEERFVAAEEEVRRRLEELQADADAQRAVLEARLHELQRRVESVLAQTS